MKWWGIAIFLLLVGCTSVPREVAKPAARGLQSEKEVREEFQWWQDKTTDRNLGIISRTGSMVPLLDSCSIPMTVKISKTEPLHINSIYGYVCDIKGVRKYYLHRLIEILDNGKLRFKGDNNETFDLLVDREQVQYILVGILYTNGK